MGFRNNRGTPRAGGQFAAFFLRLFDLDHAYQFILHHRPPISRRPLFPRLCAAACFALLHTAPIQAGPMDTGGQLAVNESGAATYTIPIQVPPGTSGIEPKLALGYNSQGGNGLLGVGWNLSGLSAITRCPRTLAQDGVRGGINLDANDRLCLDGQRLMVVSGTYGAAGSDYRTERDSFSKIIANGGATGDPTWFKVWTKAGQVIEYGNTTDSRIEAQGKTQARTWAINKISDTKQNYLTFSYAEDNPNGEYYPTRIDYTGNTTTSLTPNASVQFVYETRPDTNSGYFGGSLIKSTKRLTTVQACLATTGQTCAAGTQVKEYRLSYQTSPSTSRSRITTVQECAMPGNSCKTATTVSWSNPAAGIAGAYGTYTPQTVVIPPGTSLYPLTLTYLGDFNGDGITDVYKMQYAYSASPGASYFCAGPGIASANNCVQTVTGDWASVFKVLPADFNGDGITDLYLVGTAGSFFCAGPGIASGNNCVQTVTADWKSNYAIYPADYNGDGITDLYLVGTTASYFCAGPGIASANNCVQTVTGDWASNYKIYPGDYNGDGITDLYLTGTTASYFCAGPGIASAANCVQTVAADWKTSVTLYPGDYNGDGVTDVILASGNTAAYFCAGPGIATANNCVLISTTNWYGAAGWAYPGDYNGDGITDIIRQSPTWAFGATNIPLFCAGPGITSTDNCIQSPYIVANVGDLNGDGSADMFVASASAHTFAGGVFGRPDIVTSLNTGLGTTTTIAYQPLTNAAIYTKGSGAIYPKVDLQVPLYVVSQVQSPNGMGSGFTTTNYQYGSLKAEAGTGRGLLGFGWTQATQVETGITSRTDYRQDWPYVGLPSQAKKTLAGQGGPGNQLNLVTNTFGCINPSSGSACTVAAGNRYFPYLSQSVESSWDLNGSVLPVVTTSNAFDPYGNATQVTVSTPDGYSKTTTSTYTNDTTNWFLGRLTRSTVQSTVPDSSIPPVSPALVPSLTAISPASGLTTGGTTISLTGNNFAVSATVTIGGVVASCTVTSAYGITCTTPANTVGAKNVVVTQSGGSSTLTNGFTYLAAILTSISPTSGQTTGGTSVTLTGSNFGTGATVTIGGTAATGCTIVSATTITCTTPANTAGAKDVVVTQSGGSSTLTSGFTYVANFTLNATIAANTSNYNLKSAAIAAGWNQTTPLAASITINAGIIVGSTSTATPAFATGSTFPAGSTLSIINNGTIQGMGGNGGNGGNDSVGGPGSAGGNAIQLNWPVTITNSSGFIYGGGGGGGGGGGTTGGFEAIVAYGGGGGGGRSANTNSAGGIAVAVGAGFSGNPGTAAAAGTGGAADVQSPASSGAGGNGGDVGAAGATGAPGLGGSINNYIGGAGGAAGKAIVLNGNAVTWVSGNDATHVKGAVQ